MSLPEVAGQHALQPLAQNYDAVVIGQGLAGTALMWALRWSGERVLGLDREEPITSSRVAAGLITPITGLRLVVSWRFDELWQAAMAFYRRVEAETGQRFLRETTMVRLLHSAEERELFVQRMQTPDFAARITSPPVPPLDQAAFCQDHGACEMRAAGQLDVLTYLTASRNAFTQAGGYVRYNLDAARDLRVRDQYVEILPLNITARRVIFCTGIAAGESSWFRDVQFKPAKGELLTLHIPSLTEQRVVHRGMWLAPVAGQPEFYRAGATYEWQQLDQIPTRSGRQEIEQQLRKWLRLPFAVVNHHAAVRPVHRNQYPVLGIHPHSSRLACFNGLGSKGSLQAPYFAQHLVDVLNGCQPERDVDLNRRTEFRS